MGSNCEGFRISHFDITEGEIHFHLPVMTVLPAPNLCSVGKGGVREGGVKREDKNEKEGNGKKEEEEKR